MNESTDSEKYLKTGAHIGTKYKTDGMKKYIYKRRDDGLKVMDIQTLDSRIEIASKFISKYDKNKIIVASRKLYGKTPVIQFAQATSGKALTGRFIPGSFTNPEGKKFLELDLLIVTEPDSDFQAIKEAKKLKIPIIALCSTNNNTKDVDLIIPVNNKGRKSLALVYWMLAKKTLTERKEIKNEEEFKVTVEDFEYKIKEGKEELLKEKRTAEAKRRGKKGGKQLRRDSTSDRRDGPTNRRESSSNQRY
ncbi:MAG: 30S ribosomal protein S2 [Candidatus Diapherotrites archaeon CG10_big_fil_rev_8_21_14_0_10_31_34]|nr:MAG: 30S ribosomal protein S2 [Candidatus Diapherotrites archaeon CG10_big_fil_rev_8_21_14_0_10_31_34]